MSKKNSSTPGELQSLLLYVFFNFPKIDFKDIFQKSKKNEVNNYFNYDRSFIYIISSYPTFWLEHYINIASIRSDIYINLYGISLLSLRV